MEAFDALTLCDEKTERVWVQVWAELKDGRLTLSGQDLGVAVEEYLGTDELEYWYYFDENNTSRLISLLTDGKLDLKESLLHWFGGLDGCKKLRAFCQENKVEYKYMSWR